MSIPENIKETEKDSAPKKLPRRHRAVVKASRTIETVGDVAAHVVRRIWRTAEWLDTWSQEAGRKALHRTEKRSADRARKMRNAWEGAPQFVHDLVVMLRREKRQVMENKQPPVPTLSASEAPLRLCLEDLLKGKGSLRSVLVLQAGSRLEVRIRLDGGVRGRPSETAIALLKHEYGKSPDAFLDTVLDKIEMQEAEIADGMEPSSIVSFSFKSGLPLPKKTLGGLLALDREKMVPIEMESRNAFHLGLDDIFPGLNGKQAALDRLIAEHELWKGFSVVASRGWKNMEMGYDDLSPFEKAVVDRIHVLCESFPPAYRQPIAEAVFVQYADLFETKYQESWREAFELGRGKVLSDYEKVLEALELKFGSNPDGHAAEMKNAIKVNAERINQVLGKDPNVSRPKLEALIE